MADFNREEAQQLQNRVLDKVREIQRLLDREAGYWNDRIDGRV